MDWAFNYVESETTNAIFICKSDLEDGLLNRIAQTLEETDLITIWTGIKPSHNINQGDDRYLSEFQGDFRNSFDLIFTAELSIVHLTLDLTRRV
jgi:hypothetical protein